ncbi:hypothetical protein ILYODFUR_005857, partial [Ilyodon furcidens]
DRSTLMILSADLIVQLSLDLYTMPMNQVDEPNQTKMKVFMEKLIFIKESQLLLIMTLQLQQLQHHTCVPEVPSNCSDKKKKIRSLITALQGNSHEAWAPSGGTEICPVVILPHTC